MSSCAVPTTTTTTTTSSPATRTASPQHGVGSSFSVATEEWVESNQGPSKRVKKSPELEGDTDMEPTDVGVLPTRKLGTWFARYADPLDSGMICPEGVLSFCQDCQIEPGSIEMLVMAYKLNVKMQGYIRRDEWMEGFLAMNVDSPESLRQALPHLIAETTGSASEFKALYNYAFTLLHVDAQRSVPVQLACEMWRLLMTSRYVYIEYFVEFQAKRLKSVTCDLWKGFYDFVAVEEVSYRNYDVNAAWPVAFDEYVSWLRENVLPTDVAGAMTE